MGLANTNMAMQIVCKSKEDSKILDLVKKLWEDPLTGKMTGGIKHTITQSRNSTYSLKSSWKKRKRSLQVLTTHLLQMMILQIAAILLCLHSAHKRRSTSKNIIKKSDSYKLTSFYFILRYDLRDCIRGFPHFSCHKLSVLGLRNAHLIFLPPFWEFIFKNWLVDSNRSSRKTGNPY